MLITLFCLLPLYLLVVGEQLFGAQAVDETVGGIPVLTPGENDRLTLLLVVDSPVPAAALVRLDAWQRQAELLVLPGSTLLPAQDGRVTLQECLSAAGPLQLRLALEEALGTKTERYLCLSADALVELFREYSPLMDWEELGSIRDLALLRRFAFNGGEGVVSSGTAAALVRGNEDGDAAVAQLRAALYRAFLTEALPTLAAPATALLRSDAELLTDISAVDIYGVERLLTLLGQDPPAVAAGVPEGISVREGWQLTDAGWDALRALLTD
jgi:hypothetical protein